MKQQRKFKPNYLFTGILPVMISSTLTLKSAALPAHHDFFYNTLTSCKDTLPPKSDIPGGNKRLLHLSDTIPANDTAIIKQKTDTFSLKISKDALDAPVRYSAADSVVVLIRGKQIILYGKTKTEYQNTTLTAPKVELDQESQIVTAVNKKDSAGTVVEDAHFKDGENEFGSDTIWYNFKTQKGITKNTVTQQGELFVHGQDIKRENDSIIYVRKGMFTTCNLDDPHFAFITNKLKVVNKKLAVSGPAHPEFEDVPIPIYIPFGFYPLSQGRHSGLLPPQFATNEQYGLGLEGLGYYKVLSDYWDAKVYGNIYSYGGWSLNINPTYRKRYRYSGSFTFSVQSTKSNFKGDPDYFKTNTYNLSWSHMVDSKARPGTTFSANVNAGSTRFNQLIPNDPQRNFQNQLGSSISYSKTWKDKPFNLTMSANHSQNNFTHLINVSLPNAAFTVNTVYPFQKKDKAGTPKWYEKLGLAYNGIFRNQVSFYDTAFHFKQLLDTMQWGAQHNFPVSLSLPPILGGALIVSPSVSYSQIWIAQKFHRNWNSNTNKLDTSITKGIFMDQSASFGFSLSTALYGTYQFKHSRITKIRHVIRPSIGISYKPDFSKQHFYTTQVDTTGYKVRFSEYENSLYGHYSEGKYGGMTFQLDNNLEMKVKSKKDTANGGIKKVTLIDGYGFSTSYNFFADSMKLSPVQFYFRTNLFNKINISASTVLDPYQVNSRGQDIGKYAWQGAKKFTLGRLTTGSISLSTSFSSKPKDPKKEEERKKQVQQRLNDPTLIADQQRLLDYMQQNPSEFVDFNIPWQLSFSYSLYFSQQFRPDYSGFTKTISSNVSFNGSFNLTPKWNFSTNGYYDFSSHKIQTFQMSISRDMHCWQMSINVTPIGLYRFFSFTINPKASVLQDLRINRSRYFSGQ
ncbi:MAG: organic solvent tolerance protein OstA [Sphingobacteriales bacterium UTBCD1]|jgi:lipopolysaccharide assembly outer membrane protein LptD (OstA)|nr:MAG: organic solvent tolerance protein OstA [Sphingobacteriales bacterium UTBCD1]